MEEPPHPDAPTSSALEERVERSQDVKAVLQRIIDELGPMLTAQPVPQVRDRLVRAIADAGLPEQPKAWVESAVAELAAGRGLVMDARFEVGPQRPGPGDPEAQR